MRSFFNYLVEHRVAVWVVTSCISGICAFPIENQVLFQHPGTSMMEGIIDLHHDIMAFLIFILLFVSAILFQILSKSDDSDQLARSVDYHHDPDQLILLSRRAKQVQFSSGEGVTHNVLLESIWTIIPTLIIAVIAMPSFALIYALDEQVNHDLTVRITGHQWYWTYEYGDLTKVRAIFLDDFFNWYNSPETDVVDSTGRYYPGQIELYESISNGIRRIENLWYAALLYTWDVYDVSHARCFGSTRRASFDSLYGLFINRYGDMLNRSMYAVEPTSYLVDLLDPTFMYRMMIADARFRYNDYLDYEVYQRAHDLMDLVKRYSNKLVADQLQNISALLYLKFCFPALSYSAFAFDSYMLNIDDLDVGQFRLLEVDRRCVLPVQKAVRLLVTSSDVLHSWAVPGLGIKLDAIPGRLNEGTLIGSAVGVYYGQCSEICGVNHGFMPIKVELVTELGFLWWLITAYAIDRYTPPIGSIDEFMLNPAAYMSTLARVYDEIDRRNSTGHLTWHRWFPIDRGKSGVSSHLFDQLTLHTEFADSTFPEIEYRPEAMGFKWHPNGKVQDFVRTGFGKPGLFFPIEIKREISTITGEPYPGKYIRLPYVHDIPIYGELNQLLFKMITVFRGQNLFHPFAWDFFPRCFLNTFMDPTFHARDRMIEEGFRNHWEPEVVRIWQNLINKKDLLPGGRIHFFPPDTSSRFYHHVTSPSMDRMVLWLDDEVVPKQIQRDVFEQVLPVDRTVSVEQIQEQMHRDAAERPLPLEQRQRDVFEQELPESLRR